MFLLLRKMLVDNKASPLVIHLANEPVIFNQLDSNLNFLAEGPVSARKFMKTAKCVQKSLSLELGLVVATCLLNDKVFK